MVDLLRTYSSSEIAGWMAYLQEEERRSYEMQVAALTTVAAQLFRRPEE